MNETQLIEGYLFQQLEPGENILIEARLLLDKGLQNKIVKQQQTYALINAYGRKALKLEIEAVHKKMFLEKRFENFRNKIRQIFK